MSTLKELQESFQKGILAGDDAFLTAIKHSDKEARTVLFGVYRNAYVARLAEVLGEDYRLLRLYLDADPFADLARAYIAAHPSDRRSVRWFGRHLPDFLRTNESRTPGPEAAELASLEKALNDAFDSADAEPLGLQELAALAPEDWPSLTFTPHPSTLRLSLRTNAMELWSALQEDRSPPRAHLLPEPQEAIVWRKDVTAHFRPMPPEEAMMWDEAAKGVRFGVLCEMVAIFGGESDAALRAASYLKSWVDMGTLAQAHPASPGRSVRPSSEAPEIARRSARAANRSKGRPIRAC